jgi:hypothetical protein
VETILKGKLPFFLKMAVHRVLMMEAASTSETSVNVYQTTRRNIPEDIASIFYAVVANIK